MRTSLACTPLLSQDGERNARSRRGPHRNVQNKFESVRKIKRSADVEYRDRRPDYLKVTSVHRPPMASHIAKQKSAQLYTFNRLPLNKGKRRLDERANTNDKREFLPTPPSSLERATRTYIHHHTQDVGVSDMPRTPRNKTLRDLQSQVGNKMF